MASAINGHAAAASLFVLALTTVAQTASGDSDRETNHRESGERRAAESAVAQVVAACAGFNGTRP